MSRWSRISLFAVAVLAGGLALSGCSAASGGGIGGGSQSVDQACSIANKDLTGASKKVSSVMTSASSDAQTGADALKKAHEQMVTTAGKVTNAKIAKPTKAVADALGSYADAMQKYADTKAESDMDAVTDSVADVQTKIVDLQTACAGK